MTPLTYPITSEQGEGLCVSLVQNKFTQEEYKQSGRVHPTRTMNLRLHRFRDHLLQRLKCLFIPVQGMNSQCREYKRQNRTASQLTEMNYLLFFYH